MQKRLWAIFVGLLSTLGTQIDQNTVSASLARAEIRRAISKTRWVYGVQREVRRQNRLGGFWVVPAHRAYERVR